MPAATGFLPGDMMRGANPMPGRTPATGAFGDMLRKKLAFRGANQTDAFGGVPSQAKATQGQAGSGNFNIWEMGGDKYHGFDPFVNAVQAGGGGGKFSGFGG
jgi:hypothetical protein